MDDLTREQYAGDWFTSRPKNEKGPTAQTMLRSSDQENDLVKAERRRVLREDS